jgi:hypothetical protein
LAAILGIQGSAMTVKSFEKSTVTTHYTVPKNVCLPFKSGGTSLPLSVLLAVFDEVSTLAGIPLDPARRPGVSVVLAAEFMNPKTPIIAGSELVISSTVLKSGKTFGFYDMTATDMKTGEVVAVGRVSDSRITILVHCSLVLTLSHSISITRHTAH